MLAIKEIQSRSLLTSLALVLLALTLTGCSQDGEAGVSDPATGAATTAPAETPRAARVDLGERVRRDPITDRNGDPVVGSISWQAPVHWTEKDSSTKPFIGAEYELPGHVEDQSPALCRMTNGSAPKEGEDVEEEARDAADRVKVKTAEGRSLTKEVEIERETLGNFDWFLGSVDGHYVDKGNIVKPRDTPIEIEGYASRTAIPIEPGPPFRIECWGPEATIDEEWDAIRSWLETVEVAALP